MESLKSKVKISSKGQLVIPKDVRRSLSIREGDELILEANKNTVILKTAEPKKESKRGLRGLLKDQKLDPDECEAILTNAKKSLISPDSLNS